MMLDIDFIPCTDFRSHLFLPENIYYKKLLDSGRGAFVVPAFEYTNGSEGTMSSAFPSDKKVQLLRVLCFYHYDV